MENKIKVKVAGVKQYEHETENCVYVEMGNKVFYFDNSTGENIAEYWTKGANTEMETNVTKIGE